MKTMNNRNYEAPKAEVVELENMNAVMISGGGDSYDEIENG